MDQEDYCLNDIGLKALAMMNKENTQSGFGLQVIKPNSSVSMKWLATEM